MGNKLNGTKLVLRDACANGNLRDTKDILRKYPELLNGDDVVEPPLICAIRNKQESIIRYLYKKPELDPNALSCKTGCTALITVAGLGFDDMVRLLLSDSRVDPNFQEPSEGFSALMVASYKGYTEVVVELLKVSNLDITLRNLKGKTALDLCCEHQSSMQSQKPIIADLIEKKQEKLSLPRASITTLVDVPEEVIVTDVFISHNWGKDAANHLQVARINAALKARGIITWFDGDRMRGDLRKKMTAGIENTKSMIVCVTAEYKEKVNGSEYRDNCHYEFAYGVEQLGPQRLIVVVMEPEMRKNREWRGELGGALAGKLYHDFTNADENEATFAQMIDLIAEEVRLLCEGKSIDQRKKEMSEAGEVIDEIEK